MVPAPPQVSGQRPEPFLCGRDKAIQSAGFAYRGRNLICGLREHSDFIFAKGPGRDGLYHQNSLENATVNQGNTEKRLVIVFAGLAEIFKAGMLVSVLFGHRTYLLCHQAGEPFMDTHAQSANAL
jgi:hypothetical protein